MAHDQPATPGPPRLCAHCGGRLRRGNTGTLCDPCQRSAHTIELLAPVLPLDFWTEAEMRTALADHDLGKVSQLYRARTPIRRQHMVAELVGFSQAHISRIERGLCEIRLDTVLRFVQGLRIPPHLVDPTGGPYFGESPATVSPTTVPSHAQRDVGDQMRRRSVLKGLTGAAALVGFTLAGEDEEDPLAGDDFGRVGEAHAAQLEDAPKHLYSLDYRYGGDTLCDQASAQLRRANRLLNRGTYSGPVGRRLQVATGELGICAGWLAFDAGRQDQARYCYTEALAAARMANDPQLEVHALANMSMQAVSLDRAREGLQMAEAAQRVAKKWNTPTMEALLAMREARAHAKMSDGAAARHAMSRARAAFERRPDDENRPVWIGFFDEVELAGNEGTCEYDTGRFGRAADLLEFARTAQRDNMVRNKSLYTVRLASATLGRRDVDRAIELGEEALTMVANEVTSTRTLNELRAFRRELTKVSTAAAARNFASRFDSTVVA